MGFSGLLLQFSFWLLMSSANLRYLKFSNSRSSLHLQEVFCSLFICKSVTCSYERAVWKKPLPGSRSVKTITRIISTDREPGNWTSHMMRVSCKDAAKTYTNCLHNQEQQERKSPIIPPGNSFTGCSVDMRSRSVIAGNLRDLTEVCDFSDALYACSLSAVYRETTKISRKLVAFMRYSLQLLKLRLFYVHVSI